MDGGLLVKSLTKLRSDFEDAAATYRNLRAGVASGKCVSVLHKQYRFGSRRTTFSRGSDLATYLYSDSLEAQASPHVECNTHEGATVFESLASLGVMLLNDAQWPLSTTSAGSDSWILAMLETARSRPVGSLLVGQQFFPVEAIARTDIEDRVRQGKVKPTWNKTSRSETATIDTAIGRVLSARSADDWLCEFTSDAFSASVAFIDTVLATIDKGRRTKAGGNRASDPDLGSDSANAFEPLRTLLVTIKSSMLAIEDFDPIEESENNALHWKQIKNAVAKIRAILGGTTFGSIPLELQRLIDPPDLERLLELLEEIDEVYHLGDPTGYIGPPVPEIIKWLNKFIWSHLDPSPSATSEIATQVARELAAMTVALQEGGKARGGQSKRARDIKLATEYRELLEKRKVSTIEDFRKFKGSKLDPSAFRKAIRKGEALINESDRQ